MKVIKISNATYKALKTLGINYEDGNIEYVENPKQLSLRAEKRIANMLCIVALCVFVYILGYVISIGDRGILTQTLVLFLCLYGSIILSIRQKIIDKE